MLVAYQYVRIRYTAHAGGFVTDAFQEIFDGKVVRVTNLEGDTIGEPEDADCGVVDENPARPSWALPDVDVVDPTPPVPQVITRRQFFIQLVRAGMVTLEQASTLPDAPPEALAAAFSQLEPQQAVEVSLTWRTMTQVERGSPLVAAAIAGGVITDDQADAFFIAAAGIE